MSATTTQRVVSLVLAVVFLASTFGLVGIIVVQSNQQDQQQKELQQAIEQQNQSNTTPEDALQGKPLANFTPVEDIPELRYEDTVVGTGAEAKAGDTVNAHYTGAVAATGIVFQSSYDTGEPVAFSLNQVIQGWAQGVPGMKEGGKRRIFIPSDLAYGADPPQGSGIPADADLVFDVELVKIGE